MSFPSPPPYWTRGRNLRDTYLKTRTNKSKPICRASVLFAFVHLGRLTLRLVSFHFKDFFYHSHNPKEFFTVLEVESVEVGALHQVAQSLRLKGREAGITYLPEIVQQKSSFHSQEGWDICRTVRCPRCE